MPDELMKRPCAADDYVKRRAAELYMPSVKRWIGGDGDVRGTTGQLMKIVGPSRSGFDMVKDLEREGWCGNDDLVEIMAECADHFKEALRELTWQWVRCLNIRPQFQVGDRVAVPKHYGLDGRGEIVGVDEKQAKYNVRTAEQGPTQSWVIDFERVTALPALSDGFVPQQVTGEVHVG